MNRKQQGRNSGRKEERTEEETGKEFMEEIEKESEDGMGRNRERNLWKKLRNGIYRRNCEVNGRNF